MIMKSPRKLIGAIDMGTTKVAVLVAEETAAGMRVIGVGLAPSEGMRQGVVVDIDRARGCVVQAVRDAEQMAA
jgi:cell division protein FtsA